MKKLRIGLLCLFLSSIVCNQTIQCWSIADTGRLVVNTLKENLRPSVVGPFLRQYFTTTIPGVFTRIHDQLLVGGLITAGEMVFNIGRYVVNGKPMVSSALQDSIPRYPLPTEGMIAPATVPACIQDIITFINEPELLEGSQSKLCPAQMLIGEPGCGKTQLGAYLARSTGCKLMKVSAGGLVTGVQGTGAASIRELYKRGLTSPSSFVDRLGYRLACWVRLKRYVPDPSESKPVILILDEIDGFGKKRDNLVDGASESTAEASSSSESSSTENPSEYLSSFERFVTSFNQMISGGGSIQNAARRFNELISSVPNHSAQQNEYANTLTQLFQLIDDANRGSGVLPKVLVIATSNLVEKSFDPALMRRFEINRIEPLDHQQRQIVAQYYVDKYNTINWCRMNYQFIAQQTEGCNGDDYKKAVDKCAQRCALPHGPTQLGPRSLIRLVRENRDQRTGTRPEQFVQE